MLFGLPDANNVFMMYFDRWYKPEDRKRKGFKATRPDALINSDLKGLSPQEASSLAEEGQLEAKKMVDKMIEAANTDWPTFLSVSPPIDIQWINEFDRFHDKRRVKALIKSSKPDDFSNEFIVRCCEFGAVIGHVLLKTQPNLYWIYDWPYWESSVFDPETCQVVAVFHWAIKKFSSYGINDGFKAKLLACSDMLRKNREGQPIFPDET
jgi:hypothetical protein